MCHDLFEVLEHFIGIGDRTEPNVIGIVGCIIDQILRLGICIIQQLMRLLKCFLHHFAFADDAFRFLLCIRSDRTKEAAYRGVVLAAGLTVIFLIIARLTKTGNVTYGEGLGYSGWVIDENRNANSTNLVIFACFCIFLALRTGKNWLITVAAAGADAVFLTNGTKGCYFSIFVIFYPS